MQPQLQVGHLGLGWGGGEGGVQHHRGQASCPAVHSQLAPCLACSYQSSCMPHGGCWCGVHCASGHIAKAVPLLLTWCMPASPVPCLLCSRPVGGPLAHTPPDPTPPPCPVGKGGQGGKQAEGGWGAIRGERRRGPAGASFGTHARCKHAVLWAAAMHALIACQQPYQACTPLLTHLYAARHKCVIEAPIGVLHAQPGITGLLPVEGVGHTSRS
jgi:hypothetical protein